ncbi:uncharacterized protein [Leptinotarsa decemlineata]|uniref:uncharacterized protein n=1 Tax=Leptinotarsa decemlineata TaxID=7539 RepID=UPI000C25423C|nr:uncharacterized protein LOC111505599 [Leptinotarsa decemlineata]
MTVLAFLILIGIQFSQAVPSKQSIRYEIEKPVLAKWEVEVRENSRETGILNLLQVIIELLTNIVGIMTGSSDLDDLVTAVQNFFFSIERMANFRWIVNQIPFFGQLFSPIVDSIDSVLQNTDMVGGLLSQIIVGPDTGARLEPEPQTPPPKRNLFG